MKFSIRASTASLATIIAGLMLAGPLCAKDTLPETTADGLTRVPSKAVSALYWKDGATLAEYDKVMILEAPVAFRKNWMRDQNRDAIDLSNRINQSDMDRIKSKLSQAFKDEFTKVLQKGGYTVVDKAGEGVLLLRPAIINLDVSAPDTQRSMGVSRTFTASAGSMELYMELYDSLTSSKIGEVADAQGGNDAGHFQVSNSVTNKAEAERILRKWAQLLVNALDEAKKKDNSAAK
ncbi:MAG TPA: DUF3313 family protein [Woeseiaceae bacterium]|nr:DUF3313 family protein [Woeseiaceae bacterium]